MKRPRSSPCQLCGSPRYVLVHREDAGRMPKKIVRCLGCGLVYSITEGSDKAALRQYHDRVGIDYMREERGLRRQASLILDRLMKHRKGGRLLHIGCGPGWFLDEAKQRGWDVEGVEVSLGSKPYSAERLGLKVHRGSLSRLAFPDRSFDAVVLLDVLDHLPYPRETLAEVRRVLKSNGVFYVSAPDIDSFWCGFLGARWWGIHKHHLFYFSRNTLRLLLEAAGFGRFEYGPYPRIFSLRHWIKRLKAYPAFARAPFEALAGLGLSQDKLFEFSRFDQVGITAKKVQRLDSLDEAGGPERARSAPPENAKVIAVLPAYNAEKTLERTVRDIPRGDVHEIILTDDASRDGTVRIAEKLGLRVYRHKQNRGYGANQKTCYEKAIERGADIVVMVHPDYQYDPRIIPELIEPILKGRADAVFGSRMMKGGALEGGMPLWKHNCNILLTAFENVVLGTFLSEYHSGFRAYSTRMLRRLDYKANSDGFVFDTEIIVQILANRYRIEEVPIRTRYFEEASSIRLWPSIVYGLGILRVMAEYFLHSQGAIRSRRLEPLPAPGA